MKVTATQGQGYSDMFKVKVTEGKVLSVPHITSYLAASLLLHPGHQLVLLLVNTIQKVGEGHCYTRSRLK